MTTDPRQPKRIQMSRRRKWRADHPDAVIVDRRSDYGNPYVVGQPVQIKTPSIFEPGADYLYAPTITPKIAVLLFRIWVESRPGLVQQLRAELAGRDLACWCGPADFCHADVLLDIANPEEVETS